MKPTVKKPVPHVSEVLSDEIMPWDFRPDLGEDERCYRMFCMYRDMNLHANADSKSWKRRTVNEMTKLLNMQRATVMRYYNKYKWEERAQLYDLYIEKMKRERNEQRLLQMYDLHAKVGQQMLAKAIKKLSEMSDSDLTVNDMLKLLELGVKTERISRTEAVEQNLRTQKLKAEIKLLETTDTSAMVQIIDDVPLIDQGINDDIGE